MKMRNRLIAIALVVLTTVLSPVSVLAQNPRVTGLDPLDRRLVRYTTCALTDAQLKLLGTGSGVTCIPAQGANTAIEVISGLATFVYTATYTSGSDLKLYFGSRASGNAASGVITASGLLTSVSANAAEFFAGALAGTLASSNAAVVVQGTTGVNLASGNTANVLYLRIAYRVHNLTAAQ